MRYGILSTESNEIVFDAGETLEEAINLMARLETGEGQGFFGMTAKDKEIWTISSYLEPIAKVN